MTCAAPHTASWKKRTERLFSVVILTFLLSWLVPLMILAGPMLARTYVHIWKVVLGMEPNCAYPAVVYRADQPDCRDGELKPSKKSGQLPLPRDR